MLREQRIAGAALDVFDQEPIDSQDPLLKLDNVILAPHAICWTDELFRNTGRSALDGVLSTSAGRAPQYVVNHAVLDSPTLHQKLNSYAKTASSTPALTQPASTSRKTEP